MRDHLRNELKRLYEELDKTKKVVDDVMFTLEGLIKITNLEDAEKILEIKKEWEKCPYVEYYNERLKYE